MAESRAVWGIDIGQAGLKAVRLRYAEAAGQVLAVAFDYVPHPKLLGQPDAIPEELIPQALETFLSRNDVRGDAVAISVPGQSALTRFIQLPPVESGKVAEIVKYEARQQIPFALEDVIWDFQVLGGGQEESGYLLGAEVGLFAMKREQVAQYLKPFLDAKVEVDLIQIAPLALYSLLAYDQLGLRRDTDFKAADAYSIILDMGADNTTLLVSNGEKIWIRNLPIGGNHFTRALTKEMKLTFAKAEHLKCNATKSDDPRAVFQALRPVFNDYVAEIQRSIGYFSSVNREAKIDKIIGCGNGFKLAGLQKFLQQNLQYPVERIDSFQAAVGDTVLNAPLFEENILSFAVPYGLALQQLQLAPIHTTLLPPEIAIARKIRSKKPWAVAIAAAALLVFSISMGMNGRVLGVVKNPEFEAAIGQNESLKSKVSGDANAFTSATGTYGTTIDKGKRLVQPLESRGFWPDLYRAIDEAVPREQGDVDQVPIKMRKQVVINSITVENVDDLSEWFDGLKETKTSALDEMSALDKAKPPTGSGLIINIEGTHYNSDKKYSQRFVQQTLLQNLQQWTMQQEGTRRPIPIRLMGITHATVIRARFPVRVVYDPSGQASSRSGGFMGQPGYDDGDSGNPEMQMQMQMGVQGGVDYMGGGGGPMGGANGGLRIDLKDITESENKSDSEVIDQFDFTIQFAWRQTSQDRMELYRRLYLLFQTKSDTTFEAAKEAITDRVFTSEDFDAYKKLHGSSTASETTDN
jgi:type IV pilus assembly protein PilM